MQIIKSADESGSRLKITGALDINTVAEIHTALRELFSHPSNLSLDLSEIETCDAAGLQLLQSAEKTAETSARRLEFVGVPAAVRDTASALGLRIGDSHAEQA